MDNIVKGGTNIYDVIKKFRGSGKSCSRRDDDDHFAGIYSELYNKLGHGPDLDILGSNIEKRVGQQCMDKVYRINERVVEQALKQQV